MSDPILQLMQLHMKYGRHTALHDFSLNVQRGDIYGLIGPNGAGKTTTFKIVATIMRPTFGTILFNHMSYLNKKNIAQIRRQIGYMPDSFGVYEDMTVEEYLAFFAAAYDIRDPRRSQLVNDVLDLVDLTAKRKALIDSLSRGMQQRLGIARVLIHDPELLILDEPASGLDPRARIEIRSLLLELRNMGKTILISSHILADLGEICNRIAILEKGCKVADGTLEEILGRLAPSSVVYLRVADEEERAVKLLHECVEVQQVEKQGQSLVLRMHKGFRDVWRINQLLVNEKIKVNYIEQEAESLERAFIELTKGAVS